MGPVLATLGGLEVSEIGAGIAGIIGESTTGSEAAGAAIAGATGEVISGSGTIGEASEAISESISNLISSTSISDSAIEAGEEISLSGGTQSAIQEVELNTLVENIRNISPEIGTLFDNFASDMAAETSEILTEEELAELSLEANSVASGIEGSNISLSEKILEGIRNLKSKVTLKAIKNVLFKVIKGAITAEVGEQILTGLVSLITGKKDSDLDNIVIIDDNGNVVIDPTKVLNDPYKFGAKVADITSVMVQSVSEDLKKNPKAAGDQNLLEGLIKKSFNGIRDLSDRVVGRSIINLINTSEFFNSKEQEEEFNKIWKVYNGKNVQVWEHEGKFYFKDEIGKVFSFNGNVNEKSTTTKKGYIWLGPNSFNNSLPTNILDTYSFMHDTDYHDQGYFSPKTDMRFVSRCLQNLSRMGGQESFLAIQSSTWFLTAGHVLSTYVHPHVNTFESVKDKFLKDDLYNSVIPKNGKQKISDKVREQGQKTFYEGVEDTMDKNFAVFIGSDNKPDKKKFDFASHRLDHLILNLKIVEIY